MIKSKQDKILQIVAYVVMSAIVVVIVYPFLLLFSSSITDEYALITDGYSLIPKKLSFEAYEYIASSWETVGKAYLTTIGVTIVGTFINILITALCAYPLSLKRLRGKNVINFYLLFTMLFSGGLVPQYMIYTQFFHIRDTYFALIVPNLMFSAFNCVIMRSYLQNNIPAELIEAAKIDGASEWCILRKIILPLSKPIFATVGVLVGLTYWNDWTNGMYYVKDSDLYSVQHLLNEMINNIKYLQQYAPGNVTNIPTASFRMAIAIVAMIPILVIYPFIQKYFESGVTVGSVKG